MAYSVTGRPARRSSLARITAVASRPALVIACKQCDTNLSVLGKDALFRGWEAQWAHAPALVRLAVLCSWSVTRLVGRREKDGSAGLVIRPAILTTVVGASIRLARFEVVNRLLEVRGK